MKLPRWAAPLLVGSATFVVFAPALGNGFVRWDDRTMLLAQGHYRGLGPAALRWMWTTTYFCSYQPLTWMSYAVDYELWGLNSFGLHLTNILIHAANAVLFYFLALRLLAPRKADRPGSGGEPAAAFAALLFALHPLRVESVAWAAERKDVLAAFFFMASILAYLRAADSPESAARRWRRASLGACLLSLLSKPMGMTLPGVFVLLDVYPLGRLPADMRGWLAPAARGLWLEKLPYCALALGAGFIALRAQAGCSAVLPLDYFGLRPRLAEAAFGIIFYVWKTAAPFGLSPLYERSSLLDPAPFIAAAFLAVAATSALLALRRRFPWALAAWVYYLLVLAPVLGLVKVGRHVAADRYTYLACLAWALLAAAAFRRLWGSRNGNLLRFAGLALGAAILLELAVLTRRQIPVWRSETSLWRQAVRIAPGDYMPHKLLSAALAEQGFPQEARRELEAGRQIQADVCCRIGVLLMKRDRLADALVLLRKALDIFPGHEPSLKALDELRRRQRSMGSPSALRR